MSGLGDWTLGEKVTCFSGFAPGTLFTVVGEARNESLFESLLAGVLLPAVDEDDEEEELFEMGAGELNTMDAFLLAVITNEARLDPALVGVIVLEATIAFED